VAAVIVYQHDHAGFYVGPLEADPSPLQQGQFLIPARCVTVAPPIVVTEGMAARWSGAAWAVVRAPTTSDPVAKLQAFLEANPDVAALIG
jgi:acetyl-CoA carboxylase carboxyltransferase component